MICYYWYFLDDNYKYQPEVYNGCHDISMMALGITELRNYNTEYKQR